MVNNVIAGIAVFLAILFVLAIVALVVMAGEWSKDEERQFEERRKRLEERRKENDRLEKWLNRPF